MGTRGIRVDLASVLGREVAQVQEVTLDVVGCGEHLARNLGEAKGLGRLARTRLVRSRGGGDEQHASPAGRAVMTRLRLADAFPRLEPLQRQLEFGIREARTGFLRSRALSVVRVSVPGDVEHLRNLLAHGVERGIVEALAQPLVELRARELYIGWPFLTSGTPRLPELLFTSLTLSSTAGGAGDQCVVRTNHFVAGSGAVKGISTTKLVPSPGTPVEYTEMVPP